MHVILLPWLNFCCVIVLFCSLVIWMSWVCTLTRYATASARSDGLLLLCGGRDANSVVSQIVPLLQSLSPCLEIDTCFALSL